MAEHISFVASDDEGGKRLDATIPLHVAAISRSSARDLVLDGFVRVNGQEARPSYSLRSGDRVDVELALKPSLSASPEPLDLNIVYADEDLAVIDKPAGMVVHPSAGHTGGTLANALMAHFPQVADVGERLRPGIVHRLDKNTSGLLVVALRPGAQGHLQKQIAGRTAQRQYLALVEGHVHPESGVIDGAIGRDSRDRKRMALGGIAARAASTSYRTEERLRGESLLEVSLKTGRTHQIRVHMASLGHPVYNDVLYGARPQPGLDRHFLHAHRLRFSSPSGGRELHFESGLPPELEEVLDNLRRR